MLMALLILQAAPDIEIDAKVRVRSVTIRKSGEASLTVRAEPDGGANVVEVQAPKANGRRKLRNVEVTVHAEANIADPQQIGEKGETTRPD